MSVEQYQRQVNSIDNEIADLEKRKAGYDKKAADAQRRVNGISITKNASESMIKSKISQSERYNKEYSRALQESANLQGKIAEKRKRRNSYNSYLQKEIVKEQKKQTKENLEIQKLYENKIRELQSQAIPNIRRIDFINSQEEKIETDYDVFISHAWEDKESFVDEFVTELEKRNVKVWYDKTQIGWGDSMRERIDEGLSKSKFGIVVLSPNYIAENKYWTKTELDGLFQIESVNGKTILPIWHNLTKQQIIDYSPIIAGKKAMSTAVMTADEMAYELVKLLPNKEIENTTGAKTK